MFRSLAIVAEILLLIIVLQSSFVQYLFSDVQSDLSNWMTELSQLADKKKLNTLRNRLRPQIEAMRPYQTQYVDDILSQKASVNHFYVNYCEQGDTNPYVYGATLRVFCSEISQTDLLNKPNS